VKPTPQNKFETLASRVITCGVELRRQETKKEEWKVECYKCRKEGHKCRECPLWQRIAHAARPQKAHQQREPAHPAKEKAQEEERKLQRAEGEKEAACVAEP